MIKRIGIFFLIFPLSTYIFIILSFIIGWHICWPQISLAFLLSLFIVNYKFKKREIITNIILIILIFGVSLCLATILYDPSYDGQVYHSLTIRYLSEGWNPFYNPIIDVPQLPYNIDDSISLWISHYDKGMEIIEASVVNLTNNLESGKVLNLWWFLAIVLLSWDFLKDIILISNKFLRFIFVLLIISNPVVLNQLFTYYIDYPSYTFLCIAIICYVNILYRKTILDKFSLYLLCFFLPSIKFNITFWFVILVSLAVLLIYLIYNKFNLKIFSSCIIYFIAGFFIGAYNPTITNIIYKNNIFYPLAGNQSVDIISTQIPLVIKNESRFNEVNYSLVSNPVNDLEIDNIENPLGINTNNLKNEGNWDTRLGGFGLFFFESLVILLVLFFTLAKSRQWWIYFGSFVFLYISLFLLPAGFWARYVAYFYLIIPILSIYIYKYSLKKWQLSANLFAISLLIINGIISLASAFYYTSSHTLKTIYFISKINNARCDSIKINTISITLIDKLEKENWKHLKELEINKGEIKDSVSVTLHPPVSISYFPELYNIDDRPRILKIIGYNNLFDNKPK